MKTKIILNDDDHVVRIIEKNILLLGDVVAGRLLFEQSGIGQDEKILGQLQSTGMRPMFMKRLEAYG